MSLVQLQCNVYRKYHNQLLVVIYRVNYTIWYVGDNKYTDEKYITQSVRRQHNLTAICKTATSTLPFIVCKKITSQITMQWCCYFRPFVTPVLISFILGLFAELFSFLTWLVHELTVISRLDCELIDSRSGSPR